MTLMLACFFLSPSAHAASPPDASLDLQDGGWIMHRVADLDDNGVDDLLFGADGRFLVWSGVLGAAPAGVPVPYPMGTGSTVDIVPGDFDGDGIDDVLLSTLVGVVPTGTIGLTGMVGAPGGPVAAPWVLPTSYRRAHALGDIDGDGDDDVLIDQTVWNGSPAGPVAGPSIPPNLPEDPRFVWALGDLNGDGYDDVAFQGIPESIDWYGGTDADLVLLRGTATGLDPIPWWTYSRTDLDCGFEITLADVDGDAADELIVACISLYDESGSGMFDVLDDITTAVPTLLTSTPFSYDIGSGFDLAALDDWDGDGTDEVLLGASNKVVHLPWDPVTGLDLDPVGTMSWPSPSSAVAWITTDDISGDGSGDLTVSWFDYTNDTRTATVWLGPPGVIPTDTGDTGGTGDTGTTPTDTGDTGTPSSGTAATGDTGSPVDTGEELDDGPICGCTQAPPSAGFLALLLGPLLMQARRR